MARIRSVRRPVAPPRPSIWRLRVAPAAILVALVFGVYFNALDNPFIYDDFYTVTGNPSIADTADPRWTVVYMPFRPVVNISYAVDRWMWGYRPFGYHLTSLLLHAGVCVLLFVFLRRVLEDIRPDDGQDNRRRTMEAWAAFAGAAIFAVHPIQSETAGYVSSRSEILCALFVLGALLLARAAKGVTVGGPPPPARARRTLAAVGAFGCALLAMLSKEVAAALPVLLVAYDWLILPGAPSSNRRRLTVVFVPLALLTALVVIHRVRSLAGSDAALSKAPLLNVLTQSIVIWRYLGLMVLPAGQAIMHAAHTVTAISDPKGLAAAAGLVALVAVAFTLRRASPLYALAAVWWFACIAPSSSIIALREKMAEHRVYVASAGLALAVSAVSLYVIERASRGSERVATGLKVGLAAVLLVLSALTIARNTVWGSQLAVWKEALAASPGMWEPHYALADALRESGDCAGALPEYEAVVRDHPDLREPLTNYGICLGQMNRLPEAEAAFRRALAVDPGYARGYTNLAAVALLEGDAEQARDYYQRAIVVDPRNVHARMQLAQIYEDRLHDYGKAALMCVEARAISPSTPGVGECIARNEQRAKDAARGGSP